MPVPTRTEKKSWIPKVPRKRIRELAKWIKPVMRFTHNGERPFWSSKGYPYYIKPVDLFKTVYIWDPKPADEATGLKRLCDITTYHTFDRHYSHFMPLIADVIVYSPTANDIDRELEATNAGYHVATTRLYVQERR